MLPKRRHSDAGVKEYTKYVASEDVEKEVGYRGASMSKKALYKCWQKYLHITFTNTVYLYLKSKLSEKLIMGRYA